MDISNSLYYTFSTIAQVLSGFIALSGVFVIFKVQELKKMQFIQVQYFYNYMNNIKGLFIGSFHDCPPIAVTLKTLHKSECIGGMEEEMNKILEDPNVKFSPELISLNQMKKIFDNINFVRQRLLFWSKISIISGVLTIIFSLFILPFVTWISDLHSSYVSLLYAFSFIGMLISIFSMSWVILYSLKEKNYLLKRNAKGK